MEPFAEALAGEIDCRADVAPGEAGDVVAIVTGTPPVGPAEVAPYPNLRLVLTCTIGTDHLDVAGLRDRGLVVANTPTYCTQPFAPGAGTTRRRACRCGSPTRRSASSASGASAAPWRPSRPRSA